ncbi:class I SAM-dependent methyltransferase [Sciscionella marina]|uniref:class I SAM-dependent methyltransferase n=1 Tax=Sciscionella marina TaxID=508770 RepID=UPI000378204D|nr:class I SAM-dependent methyltransferase [Sciscionella marina]
MPRHENDEWDIASSVGLTAIGVASGRAIESQRSDRLIVDPYAALLVDASGVPTPTREPEPGEGQDHELWSNMSTMMGIRTRVFDDFFIEGWREGVTQAVVLASGLDARAWRLEWPADATVFEIDQPRVLAFKDDVLAKEGAEPRCARRAVAIDLREDWPAALEQAGFDRTRPTAWLAEGLLPYLPAEAEEKLLTAVHGLSAPGSRIAVEHADSLTTVLDSLDSADGWAERLGEQFQVDVADLFYDNDNRPRPDTRLTELGWQVTVTNGRELAIKYGRELFEIAQQFGEHQRIVTAGLAR